MKKLKKGIIGSIILSISFLLTGITSNAATIATGNLEDNFDLGGLDTGIWAKSDGWTNGWPFNCTWRGSNVNLVDGKIVLTLDKDTKGGSRPYASGELRSNNMYRYGLYQTKMKPAQNTGIVSSFFMYTGPSDNNPWDEIDIEFLGKDTTKVQFNYFTNGVGNHEYIYNLGFDASTSYHTYAFDWQPTYIAWYVDGNEVYRATSNIPTHAGKIMANLWPGIGVDGWLSYYDGVTPIKAYYDSISYSSNNSISLDNSSLDLTVGNKQKLTAKTKLSTQNIAWKSSDESVATVDQEGNVTAKKQGICTITASINGTDLKDTCVVNVTSQEPTQPDNNNPISLDKSSLDLTVGDKRQLIVTTTTSAAEVIWKSSNKSVAKVDQEGNITAKGQGTCTITVTINGTDIKDTCIVNVTEEDSTIPTNPDDTDTTGGNLYIELEDGNIKSFNVSSDEINKFIQWYKDRDLDKSKSPIYKFNKGSYKDYIIHDKIVWFEIK